MNVLETSNKIRISYECTKYFLIRSGYATYICTWMGDRFGIWGAVGIVAIL